MGEGQLRQGLFSPTPSSSAGGHAPCYRNTPTRPPRPAHCLQARIEEALRPRTRKELAAIEAAKEAAAAARPTRGSRAAAAAFQPPEDVDSFRREAIGAEASGISYYYLTGEMGAPLCVWAWSVAFWVDEDGGGAKKSVWGVELVLCDWRGTLQRCRCMCGRKEHARVRQSGLVASSTL